MNEFEQEDEEQEEEDRIGDVVSSDSDDSDDDQGGTDAMVGRLQRDPWQESLLHLQTIWPQG